MKSTIFIVPFNALIDDICDYSTQTMRILAEKKNFVVGVALGNPFSLFHDFSGFLKKNFLIKKSKNYFIFRPIMFIPGQRFELVKKLNLVINIFLLNLAFLSNKKRRRIMWFFEPKYSSVFLKFLYRDRSVFDCVDHFSFYENLKAEHQLALKKFDQVFVNSTTLKKAYQHLREDIKKVPLGFYSPPLKLKTKNQSRKKRLVFVGGIGSRIDFSFIMKLIESNSNFELTLIGPLSFSTQKLTDLKSKKLFLKLVAEKKIFWLDKIAKDKITTTVSNYDIGLIPYKKTAFNLNSFPMKVMEYFYVGLPVISTFIKELSYYPDHVYFPEVNGWQGINSFLNKSLVLLSAKRKIALKNSWEKKVDQILNNLF
ncbi:MAG: glycosyltransferase [Patescibacteria group bacterium]